MAKKKRKVEKSEIPESGFYFHDKTHTYWLDGNPLQGVTSVLGVISKPMLVPWAARMVCEYIRENAQKDGYEEFQWYRVDEEILKAAQSAHTKKKEKAADQGTDLHAQVEGYVKDCIARNDGKPFVLDNPPNANIEAFTYWALKEEIRFVASEQQLYHPDLKIAGTCDLIFEKQGKTMVGDIKTYKKIWDRVPMLQMAAYGMMYEATNDQPISGYCVICLPKERLFDEEQDVKWSFDVEGDRAGFLAALTLYRTLQNWA